VRKVLAILIVAVFISSIFLVNTSIHAASKNDFKEYMDIWNYGTASLIQVKIVDHPSIINKTQELFDFIPSDVDYSITYFNVPNWASHYNYLLSGVIFSNITWKNIPWTHMEIRLNNVISSELKEDLDEVFKTYFIYNGSSMLIGYLDYSMFKKILNKIISLPDYTRFLLWMDPQKLTSDDIFSISISREGGSMSLIITVLKDNGVKYFYWSLDKFMEFREEAPKLKYSYTSFLTIYFKDVFVESAPKNISGVLNNTSELYIYKFNIASGAKFKNPKFKIIYESPVVLLTRSFNSTSFTKDSIIKVRVDIRNLMPYPLHNITVREYEWFGEYAELVRGSVSKTIDELKSNSVDTLVYEARIKTDKVMSLYIGPAEAILNSATGLKRIFYSNTNVIYLNTEDSPFIYATLDEVKSSYDVGGKLKYSAVIKNIGDSPVDSVVFGEYIIGSLKPGEERRIEDSISLSKIGSRYFELLLNASYMFNGTEYKVATQDLRIFLYPRKLYYPYLDVQFKYGLKGNELNLTVVLSNKGLFDVEDVNVVILNLYGSSIVEGDLKDLSKTIDLILVNQSKTLSTVLRYPNNTISAYPHVIVTSRNLISPIYSQFRYFYNTINISEDVYSGPYIINYNYTLTIRFLNTGDTDVYNLTISSLGGDLSLSPERFNYTLVSPYEAKSINFTFSSEEAGNFTLPDIRYTYWYLGSVHEGSFSGVDVKFYRGIWINYEVPAEVSEGDSFALTIRIESDSYKYINHSMLSIYLPDGLEFSSGSNILEKKLVLNGSKNEVEFRVRAVKPGEYELRDIKINYVFNGIELSHTLPETKIPVIKVRENVLMRYWIYFIPMLILALVYVYLIRKRIY